MVKHGNWNAYQKTEEELNREELERLSGQVGKAMKAARQMFEVLNTSDLSDSQQAAAVEILGVLHRRINK